MCQSFRGAEATMIDGSRRASQVGCGQIRQVRPTWRISSESSRLDSGTISIWLSNRTSSLGRAGPVGCEIA